MRTADTLLRSLLIPAPIRTRDMRQPLPSWAKSDPYQRRPIMLRGLCRLETDLQLAD